MSAMEKIKTIIIIIIAILLLISGTAGSAGPDFSDFEYVSRYTAGQFSDVENSRWFSEYVRAAYNFGFLRGTNAGLFEPQRLLSLGEAAMLAVRMRGVFFARGADFPAEEPLFLPYVDYALKHDIIKCGDLDFFVPVTRAKFADMIYRSLPERVFAQINTVPDFAIPDVSPHDDFGQSIYALYRAGIFTGSDRFGTFFPNSELTRAEACAVTVRTANPALRVNTALPAAIPADIIFRRITDAVFMIETFDEYEMSIRTAGGFFLTSTGLALTNFHVFDFAVSATVTLTNGKVYAIAGFHAVCLESNLAVFSITSEYEHFDTLTLGDSDIIETGNRIYTLGNPMGLINSLSHGIVSSKSRLVNDRYYVQFSAPISFGSGGSPLINTLGQVIGVTYLSFTGGQNLNLAVPINRFRDMIIGENPVPIDQARYLFEPDIEYEDHEDYGDYEDCEDYGDCEDFEDPD